VPLVEGLKAVRRGSGVDVSWRTDRKAEPESLGVIGLRDRDVNPEGAVMADARSSDGRRFTARLKAAKEIRYVFVFVASEGGIGGPYVTKVR
jgi:hypothetical protein